jgi:hypothetical protein
MAPFESDGVYDGIPYRVLPDASIEAITPGGLVRFKGIDQFLAFANDSLTKPNATRLTVSYDMPHERSTNVPASAGQLDYYSILLDAIERTKHNSAQLRQLVYERARFNFKRDVLFGHSSLGLSDLVQHINDFELAVARIEATATDDPPDPKYRESECETTPNRIEATTRESAHLRAARADAEVVESVSSSTALQILEPQPAAPSYAEFSPVQQMESLSYDRRAEGFASYRRAMNPLVGASIIGIVLTGIILASGTLWFLLKTAPEMIGANLAPKAEKTIVIQQNVAQEPAAPKLPYPLPTSFGIYALSDNKLVELQALAMNVPDPRVALSAEIRTPSTTTISDNRPSFILFRRDLVNSVPQKITLRVVARLMRETKFVSGKATSIAVDGTWRIRNISQELRISPIPGQREMVIAHLEDNVSLAAGRYELALNRIGFDFTVAGPIKAPAQCLEQFESTSGPIYTECRTQ